MNTSKPTFLAYGGWWEDKNGVRNDNDFNNNGLVSADRIPHPSLHAIKYVYRNLHTTQVSTERIKVKNWAFFTNPKDTVAGTWEVIRPTARSSPVARSRSRHRARRGEGVQHRPAHHERQPAEYFLNVSYKLKQPTLWGAIGHEVAWDQFQLKEGHTTTVRPHLSLKFTDSPDETVFTGPDFSVRVDKHDGLLRGYRYKGVTLLERGPRPDFWRAPTSNDKGAAKSAGRANRALAQCRVRSGTSRTCRSRTSAMTPRG